MNYKVFDDSRNYVCQVIKLPHPQAVPGLDRLVNVCVQGNNCLVGKDTNFDEVHLFFCSETVLSPEFLSKNNLYRHSELNEVKDRKGFFEDSGRVKAVKFKGVVSSGFVIPLTALANCLIDISTVKVGDEFNVVDGVEICRKYIRKVSCEARDKRQKLAKLLDAVVDSRMAPEHFDTSHFGRNLHKFDPSTKICVTEKYHGFSHRIFNTLTKRKLRWYEKLAKWFGVKVQEEEYNYVTGSRHVIKSVGFEELPNKSHFYDSDIWTAISKEYFEGKLLHGEGIYSEVIGKDYGGKDIQPHYNYGFDRPKVFIYRISHINPHGVEVDLTYEQMKIRTEQLGIPTCPEVFVGTVLEFVKHFNNNFNSSDHRDIMAEFERIVYQDLLEKPEPLQPSVPAEGVVVRIDSYPKPEAFKAKAKAFLEYESKSADAGEVDMEEQEAILE